MRCTVWLLQPLTVRAHPRGHGACPSCSYWRIFAAFAASSPALAPFAQSASASDHGIDRSPLADGAVGLAWHNHLPSPSFVCAALGAPSAHVRRVRSVVSLLLYQRNRNCSHPHRALCDFRPRGRNCIRRRLHYCLCCCHYFQCSH